MDGKEVETRTVNNHPHMQSFTQHAFVSQLNTDIRDTCSCGSLGASHTIPRDPVPKNQGSGVSYLAPMNKVNTPSAVGELGNSRTPPTTLTPTLLSLNPYATLRTSMAL